MRKRNVLAGIAIGVSALLGVAVSNIRNLTPIDDLALVEFRLVPGSEVPDPILNAPDRQWWKLEFTGDANWVAAVHKWELTSYTIAKRCDQRDSRLYAVGPYVDGRLVSKEFGAGPLSSGPVRYVVYLAQTGSYRSQRDFNAKMPSYDLATERLPLCIRFAGGSMYGAYGKTNEVQVTLGGR